MNLSKVFTEDVLSKPSYIFSGEGKSQNCSTKEDQEGGYATNQPLQMD